MGIEHARYESQVVSLEKSVLPLFAERLPDGAKALGVGASLDGAYLRLFVSFDTSVGTSPLVASTGVTAAAAAAAVALGSLLGCEIELLAGCQGSMTHEKLANKESSETHTKHATE